MNNTNFNKVEFNDVEPIFEEHNIWSGGTEIFWYQLAWECLEKEGLTDYSNIYDLAFVYIRAYTLIMIYGEFSSFISNRYYTYEFFRENVEEVLSDFTIGQLIMKSQYEFNKLQNHFCEIEFYDNENIENAFFELIDNERYKVFNAIVNHISKFQNKIFKIFVALYITVVTPYKNIADKIPEEILSYESYLSVYEKHYDAISEIIDESDEVLGWLLEGTYKKRGTILEITNETFENLMEIKKKFKEKNILLPARSKYSQFEILSLDERNSFIIDIDRRDKIEMKSKLQERYMGNIALIRLEIDGPPHTNPDGTIISRDHIHIYQEGYDLSWAYELKEFNTELFRDLKNFNKVFTDFCFYCNIEAPGFQMVI